MNGASGEGDLNYALQLRAERINLDGEQIIFQNLFHKHQVCFNNLKKMSG